MGGDELEGATVADFIDKTHSPVSLVWLAAKTSDTSLPGPKEGEKGRETRVDVAVVNFRDDVQASLVSLHPSSQIEQPPPRPPGPMTPPCFI